MKSIFENLSAFEATEKARELYGECPKSPVKPVLRNNASSSEVREHANLLESYEEDKESHKILNEAYRDNMNKINGQLEYHIKDQAGMFDCVPKQYQDKLWYLAWEYGHSSGYHEVYNYLTDLVGIFE